MTTDKEEIVKGNKAIQLFMIKGTVSDEEYEMRSIKHLKHFEDLKYHSSWDWLKPVIDKVYEYSIACHDAIDPIRKMSIVVDIKPAWHKIINAIEKINMYNAQSTKLNPIKTTDNSLQKNKVWKKIF